VQVPSNHLIRKQEQIVVDQMFRARTKRTPSSLYASILLLETLVILIAFNASNCFRTTNYVKSIDFISIALTILSVFGFG